MKESLAKIEIDTWLIATRIYLCIAGAFMNYGVLKRAQEELLDQIIGTEEYIKKLRGKRKAIDEERKGPLQRKGLDSRSKKRLERLEQVQRLNQEKEGLLKERLTLLRRLGDMIAWYAYGFNRHAILELYRSHRKPASITGRRTLDLERRVIDAINNKGDAYFALMHDLTHCLSIADLTIFYPQGYQVIELKIHPGKKRAIRRDDRTKRQETLLKQIQEYEITGESEELIPGFLVKRLKIEVPDKYEWKLMERLLKRAMLEGYALESVEGIVVYAAYELDSYEEVLDEVIPLIHEKGQTFVFRSLDRHKQANTAHLLPLFAFEMHPLLIVDLVAGNLVLMTFLNIDRLLTRLRESGVRVARRATGPGVEIGIQEEFVDRILLEGLSLDTFVAQCVEAQRLGDELWAP
jgi:hypothetical protein